jgi:hypothetical protein
MLRQRFQAKSEFYDLQVLIRRLGSELADHRIHWLRPSVFCLPSFQQRKTSSNLLKQRKIHGLIFNNFRGIIDLEAKNFFVFFPGLIWPPTPVFQADADGSSWSCALGVGTQWLPTWPRPSFSSPGCQNHPDALQKAQIHGICGRIYNYRLSS